MALSPAHRLGQSIGEQLEAALHEPLQAIAQEFGLYLDYPHKRPARSNRKEVAWQDAHGNTHNLDYVLEEGGSENERGRPRAFIENAWRRYTKHSRNKVQEIQGAVGPRRPIRIAVRSWVQCWPVSLPKEHWNSCNPITSRLPTVLTRGSYKHSRASMSTYLQLRVNPTPNCNAKQKPLST